MTIERGVDWGEPRPLPADGVVVRSDHEARSLVEQARRDQEAPPVLGLLGGDLCRTLGGRGDERRLRSDEARTVPIDIGSVLVDGRQFWFIAHLVARRGWLRGPLYAVMNVSFLGDWNVVPRGHPNDGRLDIIETDLSVGDRLKARRRLRSGSHVPHPEIRTARVRAEQHVFDRPTPIRLDGGPPVTGRRLSIRVEPDALTVVV